MFMTDRITNLTSARQTPRYGKLRDEDYDRGDFVFLLASSGAVVDAPAPAASSGQGSLSIEANVRRCDGFCGRQTHGNDAVQGDTLGHGPACVIRVEAAGYQRYQKRIAVDAGRTVSLYVDLTAETPAKGRIFVDTEPGGATVKILNITPSFFPGY